MRKILVVAVALALGAGGYALSPLRAAWEIREAMRLGDTATLARRVDWPAVRRSLKQSTGETRQLLGEITEASGAAKPGLWQRIKTAAAPILADPLIDRYVTPEGAPQLWAWRQTWRQRVRPAIGLAEPSTPLSGTWLADTSLDRALSVARRLERAAFTSPTRIELELRDRYTPGRRWHGAMELRELAWTLTEVHVRRSEPATAASTVQASRP